MFFLLNAMTIGLLIGYSLQDAALENQAVTRMQLMSVSQIDTDLPDQPFAAWIKQIVGSRAGLTWQLADCGELAGSSSAKETDIQACVEMTAVLPDERKVVVTTIIGTFKRGIVGKPKLLFAVIESKGDLFDVPKLRDLPDMLRTPLVKKRLIPVNLPSMTASKNTLVAPPSQTPALPNGPGITPETVEEDDVSPPKMKPRRVSEGVLQGNVINKVLPSYPMLARQLRLGGEVKVEVIISEDGRVIEARAISGPTILRGEAEEAARKWVFKPTLLNNKPVQTQGVLTFVFARP